MFRIVMSIAALAVMLASAPSTAFAQQPAAAKAGARSSTKPSSGAIVNVNTASATELQTLPGVGAKTAGLIVEYRQKNGPFKKVEELMNVRGIGEKNFLKLKPQISIAGTPAKGDHDQARQQ
jgi:competence protein ComEA